MSAKKAHKSSFEESLRRLETIVEQMDKGDVSLEETLALYEEGIQLSKQCADALKAAELRIRKLGLEADSQLQDLSADEE